jgi:rfaE bifunctional protein nucleotidyltransferase chain/domain
MLGGVVRRDAAEATVPVKRASRPTPLAALIDERAAWRAAGLKVVLTNGCFDLLHRGHLALLEMARGTGDVLVVALNSDASVRALKGGGRPIVPEAERAEVLLALEAVDRVVVYDEPTPIEVVRALLPDVLAKGADWAADAIVGRPEVERSGGRVVRVATVPGRSTSAIVDRMRRP